MKKALFIFGLGILLFQNLKAQENYKLITKLDQITQTLRENSLGEDDIIRFKKAQNRLQIIIPYNKNISNKSKIIEYNLETEKVLFEKEFDAVEGFSWQNDFLLVDSQLYFVNRTHIESKPTSVSELFRQDLNTGEVVVCHSGLVNQFEKIEKINDSLILLYSLYPYHPADGNPKLNLITYNYQKGKIENERLDLFEGISLGNIVNQWVSVINNRIYTITPLTGKLSVYDLNLFKINQENINLPELNIPENKQFITQLDSVFYDSHIQFEKYKASHSDATTFSDLGNRKLVFNFFTKSKMGNKIENLRTNYCYIEKILPYNDTMAVLSIYKAGTNGDKRKVMFLNIKTFQIEDSIRNWICFQTVKDKPMENIEEYLTVDLGNSPIVQPFFFGGKVYAELITPTQLYRKGMTYKEMQKKIFEWQKKNPLQWQIGVFQLLR